MGVFLFVEAWVGMFASPLATVAERNLTHCLRWFAARRILMSLANLGAHANRAGSIPTQTNKNTPQWGVFLFVEAWVGIEPASKDLQSSA